MWKRIRASRRGVKLTPLVAALIVMVVAATAGISQVPPQESQASDGRWGGQGAGVASAASPAEALARVGAAGEMIGFSGSDASGTQTITLVHTGKSWMAVYHIDRSGKIRLVSSRPIDADFSLQLNATSPLPDEIRELGRR